MKQVGGIQGVNGGIGWTFYPGNAAEGKKAFGRMELNMLAGIKALDGVATVKDASKKTVTFHRVVCWESTAEAVEAAVQAGANKFEIDEYIRIRDNSFIGSDGTRIDRKELIAAKLTPVTGK
jgi:hypothetical protein